MIERTLCGAALAAVACFTLQAPALADPAGLRAGQVDVMTRNIYVGADIFAIVEAQSPEQIPPVVTAIIRDIQSTDFGERAGALADEIAATDPHLVGLQEVSLLRTQCPGDSFLPGGGTPATDVFADYLQILLDALAARGLDYYVAAEVENADVELPAAAFDGAGPLLPGCLGPFPVAPLVDARLTDRDVILARADVPTGNAVEANYSTNLEVPTAAGAVPFVRGYTMVDAEVNGRTYRFVNTHLEVSGNPFARAVQFAQASELAALLAADPRTRILVGDLNSSPDDGAFVTCAAPGIGEFPCPTPYGVMRLNGWLDAWDHRGGPWSPGYTCCHADDLSNEVPTLDERIDLVLVRAADDHFGGPVLRGVQAEVLGDEPGDRTPGGLWPSDHAGVVSRMTLRTR